MFYSDTTVHARVGEIEATSGPSDWLGGLNVDNFDGDTLGARLVRAAASIKAVRAVFQRSIACLDILFFTGHCLAERGLGKQ